MSIRTQMPEKTLCRKCIHAMDYCDDIKKKKDIINGYVVIVECKGFELQQDKSTT